MSLFNYRSKTSFNKPEAKKEISSLAKKANQIIKSNQIMQNEYDFWFVYSDLIKEVINRYMSSSSTGLNKNTIIKDINDTETKLKLSNDNLKQDITSIKLKLEQSLLTIDSATKDLNIEMEKKREDLFFLENNVLLKQYQIEKTKKEIENVNIVQELERDVYISESEKSFMIFNTENLQQQEILTKIGKELNAQKLRKTQLLKECSMLKKKLKGIMNHLKDVDSNNNTHYENQNNQMYNRNELISKEDETNKDEKGNETTEELIYQAKELENISFTEFSEEKSFDKDEAVMFPDKIHNNNYNDNEDKDIDQDNEILPIPNSIPRPKIQLPNLAASNQSIPKLDLKQIEFNKSKVKGKFISLYSNNVNPNNEDNNNANSSNNDHQNANNSNSKNNNHNKNTKPNTYSTTQKENKIEQIRIDISIMNDKLNSNKETIRNFKIFHKKAKNQYNTLQMKYDKIKKEEKKQQVNITVQESIGVCKE